MLFVAVNHHYVAEERPASSRAIFPTTVAELAAEVERLARTFELVSRDDLVRAVNGSAPLPDKACLITFDDGLRSQFELALPVLELLGARALFLVPGQPLAEGRALQVHKIHALRERLADAELLEQLRVDVTGHETEAASMYGYDSPEAAMVKYALNVALPFDRREAAVDAVFQRVFGGEEEFCAGLYMGAEQVAELERRHRAVGAHSYAHRPLSRLGPDGLRDDLERNAGVLEALTGARPAVISYPYGSPDAVDRAVAAAAEQAGFVAGFTMERAFNRSLAAPLLLARIDVNDAPGGSHALFDLAGGEPVLRAGMTAARERYLTEEDAAG